MKTIQFIFVSFVLALLSIFLWTNLFFGQISHQDERNVLADNRPADILPGQSESRKKVPSFFHFDLEPISAYFSEEVALSSAVSIDWYPAYVMVHLGIGGVWIVPEALMYEAGISIPISKEYKRNVPVTQIFYEGQEHVGSYVYNKYKVQKGHADMVVLHLIDIGLKSFSPFYVGDSNPDWNPVIYGKQYASVTDVDYYAYDKIIYLGYRYMSLRSRVLTSDEIVFYAHFLLGITDRKAEIWDNFSSSSPAYTATESGTILYGFDAGIRWHMTQFRFGYYDGNWYGGAGFRFAFNTL